MYEAVELQLEEVSYYESVTSRIDEKRFANHKLLRQFLGARRFRRHGKQKQAEMELSEGKSWSSVEEGDASVESETEEARNDAIKERISSDNAAAAFFPDNESEVVHEDKETNHLSFFDLFNTKIKSQQTVRTENESLKEIMADYASFLENIREEPDWASSGEEDVNDSSSGVFASYSFNRNCSEMATRSFDNAFVSNEETSSIVVSVASPPIPKKNELKNKEAKRKCTFKGRFKNCLGKRATRRRTHCSLVRHSESKTSLPEPPIPKKNELNDKEAKRKRTIKSLFKNCLGKRTTRRDSVVRPSESKPSLPEYPPGYEPLVISKTESFKDQRVPFSAALVRNVACVAPLSSSFSAKSHQDSDRDRGSQHSNIEQHSSSNSISSSSTSKVEEDKPKVIQDNSIQPAERGFLSTIQMYLFNQEDDDWTTDDSSDESDDSYSIDLMGIRI